jgi:hypothetical protein
MFLRDHDWLLFTSSRASGQLSADLELRRDFKFDWYKVLRTLLHIHRNARLVK